jgi:hypothetical protein
MTWQLGARPGVVDAVDRFGRPMQVPLPEQLPACRGDCGQSDKPCPHPELCVADGVGVDRDMIAVIAWASIGLWIVLLWWALA